MGDINNVINSHPEEERRKIFKFYLDNLYDRT